MKSLIISVIVLLLIISFVIFISVFTNSVTSEMLCLINSLPSHEKIEGEYFDMDFTCFDKLIDIWKKANPVIALGVNYDYISMITVALNNTEAFCRVGEPSEYEASKVVLEEAVKRLQASELFKLENIF